MSEPTRSRDAVIDARVAEAVALLAANQAARSSTWRALTLALGVATVATAAGFAGHTRDVLLPVAPALCLLVAFVAQQQADLTIMGMARRRLEELVNAELGADVLIYETLVAPLHKERGMYASVPILQVATLLAVAGVSVWAVVTAFEHSTLGGLAETTAVVVGAAIAVRSIVEMLRSDAFAYGRMRDRLVR
jgi:hypothetical protein